MRKHGVMILALALAVMLTACKERPPKVPDSELFEILGGGLVARANQISDGVVDCIRLLSGLDDEIYQDVPATELGELKTQCRLMLSIRLRNHDTELELRHFNNQELAERITALARGEVDKVRKAKIEIQRLALGVDEFYLDTGRAPRELRDLVQRPDDTYGWNGPYVNEANLTDPWDNPYSYRNPGECADVDISTRVDGDGEKIGSCN